MLNTDILSSILEYTNEQPTYRILRFASINIYFHKLINEKIKPKICTLLDNNAFFLMTGKYINDDILSDVSMLTHLILKYSPEVTDNSLSKLRNLKILDLSYNTLITDKTLSQLHLLEELHLSGNSSMTNASVSCLTNLSKLYLDNNSQITDNGIQNLSKLRLLSIVDNNNISIDCISNLTNFNLKCVIVDESEKKLILKDIFPKLKFNINYDSDR